MMIAELQEHAGNLGSATPMLISPVFSSELFPALGHCLCLLTISGFLGSRNS